jgi:DNA-binding transcriptional LysR family regulator
MDLWQLNIFCKVIELQSFSKAGEKVHLSQPTVSSHIKDLEEHFGCRLIDRLSRKAVPTKAGELLYSYAQRLLDLRNETETALADFQGKIKGRLVIGGSTIPGTYILPRIVGAFTERHPETILSLVIGDTENIVNDTLAGILEIGVVGASAGEKRLIQEPLIEDEMCLAVPADHKWAQRKSISLKTLPDEPFIIRESGSGTLKSLQMRLAQKGYHIEDLKIAAEMGSTEAVIQGIKSNVGVSILSAIAVSDALKAGSIKTVAISGLNLRRTFYLTRHKYRSPSPLCQAFINFLKESLLKKIEHDVRITHRKCTLGPRKALPSKGPQRKCCRDPRGTV